MISSKRLLGFVACVVVAAAVVENSAWGFFPKGGFNFTQQLRYATWPFREFDNDESGVIDPGEGLEFRIESGPRGFTNAEIAQVQAAFQTWQDVGSSYASFRFVGSIEDTILPGTLGPDYLPMVFMQVTEVATSDGYSQPDPPEAILPELSWSVASVTIVTYAIDTAILPVGGNQVIIPAGTIIDCDIVVNGDIHRAGVVPNTTFGTLDLQATVTHAVGHLLGLSFTPLNNLDPYNQVGLEQAVLGLPVEPSVLQITTPDGIRRMMGATPTMFPIYFLTEMPDGSYNAGWRDLAPDDISGVSWLYPRQDGLENFFTINQEARTHVRRNTGIPSSPISGAHIVAWANLSTGEAPVRVPLFSTMTGLYQKYTNTQLVGKFSLMGLWKQMEVPGRLNEKFEPTYVLTMNPLNGSGFDRQAPPGFGPGSFDSIQGPLPLSYSTIIRPDSEFSTNYPSEVFNEFGNVYGIDNYSVGTPLVWSFVKNTVVSKETDRTLPHILPTNTPMFGDPDQVCPFNILEGGTTEGGTETILDGLEGLLTTVSRNDDDFGGNSGQGMDKGSGAVFHRINSRLRIFRDRVLLRTAIGTAAVDLYYRTAPTLARYLLNHKNVLHGTRSLIIYMDGIGKVVTMGSLFALVLGGFIVLRLFRNRVVQAATMTTILILLLSTVAFAGQTPIPTEYLVADSTHILTGEVVSAVGRLSSNNRIYTDVVVKVRDVVKGNLNRGSTITFSVIGGQYGNIVTAATDIPGFSEGDQALLYLQDTGIYGLVPFGGSRSKVSIVLNPETGEEEVAVQDATKVAAFSKKQASAEKTNEDNSSSNEESQTDGSPGEATTVPLQDYLRYLRTIVHSQR